MREGRLTCQATRTAAQAYDANSLMPWIGYDTMFDTLRSDPRSSPPQEGQCRAASAGDRDDPGTSVPATLLSRATRVRVGAETRRLASLVRERGDELTNSPPPTSSPRARKARSPPGRDRRPEGGGRRDPRGSFWVDEQRAAGSVEAVHQTSGRRLRMMNATRTLAMKTISGQRVAQRRACASVCYQQNTLLV